MLGRLAADSRLAGDVVLDAGAAEDAVASLAGALGLDPIEAAEGIVRIANQEMVRALRVVTVERGIDPRSFALLPFGGAGPMHAAEMAAELEIDRILCPRAGGVLSALGLCASDRRRDTARTVMLSGSEFTAERVAAAVEELAAGLGSDAGATPEVTYEMRYAGQAFELPVSGPARPDPADLAERFAAAHEQLYGHRDPGAEVVLVHIRLAMVTPGARPRPKAATGTVERGSRRVRFEGEWLETPILRGEPAAATETEGPVVFELPETTFVLPPGWRAEVDETGTIRAEAESATR
jgi:N-methylhydantoinase A